MSEGAFSTIFSQGLLAALSMMSSNVPFDGFQRFFLMGSVVFLSAPLLGVSDLAYIGWVEMLEIWPRRLVRNEFLTWWCPGLSVPGLTRYGRGLAANWRTSRRWPW